jgi:hypothetical protein
MGATFIVSKSASWLPHYGSFEDYLTLIAEELKTKEPSISAEMVAAMEGFPFMDISGWDVSRFRILLEAALKVYERQVDMLLSKQGNKAEIDLSRHLSDLKTVLMLDLRSGSNLQNFNYSIVVRDNAAWTALAWAYDYVLEQMASLSIAITDISPAITRLLVTNRTVRGERRCDLSEMNAHEMGSFVRVLGILKTAQINSRVSSAYAPEFDTDYFPRLPELYDLFRSDPRIVKHEDWQLYE